MLTVFIVQTTEHNRSMTKTLKSVEGLANEFLVVGNVEEINNNNHKPEWFMILYDTEYVGYDLRKAIELILRMKVNYDALIFMKKNLDEKLYQAPRMFKGYIKLRSNSFLPVDESSKMERILDGWIYEHV